MVSWGVRNHEPKYPRLNLFGQAFWVNSMVLDTEWSCVLSVGVGRVSAVPTFHGHL